MGDMSDKKTNERNKGANACEQNGGRRERNSYNWEWVPEDTKNPVIYVLFFVIKVICAHIHTAVVVRVHSNINLNMYAAPQNVMGQSFSNFPGYKTRKNVPTFQRLNPVVSWHFITFQTFKNLKVASLKISLLALEFNNEFKHVRFTAVLIHPLTGLEGLSPPPPWVSWGWHVREEWGLLSLLMCPDSAMSTPLSSLRVWPLSDSWDRAPPESKQADVTIRISILFSERSPVFFFFLFSLAFTWRAFWVWWNIKTGWNGKKHKLDF